MDPNHQHQHHHDVRNVVVASPIPLGSAETIHHDYASTGSWVNSPHMSSQVSRGPDASAGGDSMNTSRHSRILTYEQVRQVTHPEQLPSSEAQQEGPRDGFHHEIIDEESDNEMGHGDIYPELEDPGKPPPLPYYVKLSDIAPPMGPYEHEVTSNYSQNVGRLEPFNEAPQHGRSLDQHPTKRAHHGEDPAMRLSKRLRGSDAIGFNEETASVTWRNGVEGSWFAKTAAMAPSQQGFAPTYGPPMSFAGDAAVPSNLLSNSGGLSVSAGTGEIPTLPGPLSHIWEAFDFHQEENASGNVDFFGKAPVGSPSQLGMHYIANEHREPTAQHSVTPSFDHHDQQLSPNGAAPAASIPPYPTAASLLGNDIGIMVRQIRIPVGLQRITTQQAVDKAAQEQNILSPPILDTDVTRYWSSHQTKPTHALKSFATPVNIDIRILGNLRITAAEIIAFFPNHFKWHDCIFRLVQNGWPHADIAKYINHIRQLDGANAETGKNIAAHSNAATKALLGASRKDLKKKVDLKWRTTCFVTKDWLPPSQIGGHEVHLIQDYFLVDLAEGLVKWPTGSGARILTRAVQTAVHYGHRHIRLSQLGQYVRDAEINRPWLQPMAMRGLDRTRGVHPDVVVLDEVRAEMQKNDA